MAEFSCFRQDLAAAFGHFELAGSRSTLILIALSHTLFAQFFSLWFEIRAEAMILPPSAAKGNPCLIQAFLCLETSAGLSAQALLPPDLSSSVAEAAESCFVSI